MSGRIISTIFGKGGDFLELGHHAFLGLLTVPWNGHDALGVSFSLLTEDQGLVLSTIVVPFDSNRFMLSWAMSFFQKLCPVLFPPVTFLAFFSFLFEAGITKNCTYHSLNTMCQTFHTNYLLKTTQNIGIFITHSREGRSSLVAQLVKNLPAMQETTVQFLGQEDSLEK